MAFNPQGADSGLNDQKPGIIYGIRVRDPQSATLTATVEGGIVRLLDSNGRLQEFTIQTTTKAFTLSKDTYVYINGAGAVAYLEVANNAVKPTQATLLTTGGVGSYFVAKVVTDGTRVVSGGVSTYSGNFSSAWINSSEPVEASFVTANQGAYYWQAPFDLRLLKAQASVSSPLGATDAGTITLASGINDVYTNMTNGVITLALSSAVGTRADCFPTTGQFIRAGDYVRFTSAKTTTGGTAMVQVVYTQSTRP